MKPVGRGFYKLFWSSWVLEETDISKVVVRARADRAPGRRSAHHIPTPTSATVTSCSTKRMTLMVEKSDMIRVSTVKWCEMTSFAIGTSARELNKHIHDAGPSYACCRRERELEMT